MMSNDEKVVCSFGIKAYRGVLSERRLDVETEE